MSVMFQHMHVQNHAYTNKSMHTYVRDVCQLLNLGPLYCLLPLFHNNVCFMQQGTNITEVWHIMWFFTNTLIWYHTHKTHRVHSGASRLTHPLNIHLHHLLCAHSSYLYYIQWLMNNSLISKIYSYSLKNLHLFTCKSYISVD